MQPTQSSIKIIDVSPRDGLQIESVIPTVDAKVTLIEGLIEAGVPEIEVGSFVSPKVVPQMADSNLVIDKLRPRAGVRYKALWLNLKGLERALTFPILHIDGRLSLTASDAFSRRNTNRGIAETLSDMGMWIDAYEAAGITARSLSVMAAFGCNFEGKIDPLNVLSLVERVIDILAQRGCRLQNLCLADTMGWANPRQIEYLVATALERWPWLTIRLHLHDTRGCAVANALAGIAAGVKELDASVGGLGGCPFAAQKGAAGNLCTEDLVFACEEMGISTGIDIDRLIEVAKFAECLVGHELPGKIMKGGSLSTF